MNFTRDRRDLKKTLASFEEQKTFIEKELSDTPQVTLNGATNFYFFKLKKSYQDLESNIRKINSLMNPDIIA